MYNVSGVVTHELLLFRIDNSDGSYSSVGIKVANCFKADWDSIDVVVLFVVDLITPRVR